MLVLGADCAIVMSTPSEGLEERDTVRICVEQSPDVAAECHDSRETQLGEVMANESLPYTERRTQNGRGRLRHQFRVSHQARDAGLHRAIQAQQGPIPVR